jgi:hypothetical protein
VNVKRSGTSQSSFEGRKEFSPVAPLSPFEADFVTANASEITGLPRDNFEVYEISKDEFERLRSE